MAGTTVTDDGVVERAFIEAMMGERLIDESELPGALSVVRRTMGQSKIDVFRSVLGDEGKATAANAAFEAAYERFVRRGDVQAIPGAEHVLQTLRGDGIRVCLITGFAPTTRDEIVDSLRWGPLIDLALSPADVGRGRPWPDLVLSAARHFGVAPAESAVCGDTVSDLLCGTRAGSLVVAGVVHGDEHRVEMEAAPHTHLLDSITELPEILAADPSGAR